MKFLFTFLSLIALFTGKGQDPVINFLYTSSSFTGGVEGSGTSTSDSYYCVLIEDVVFTHLIFGEGEDRPVKGDTIVFSVNGHYSYNSLDENPQVSLNPLGPNQTLRTVLSQGIYYVNIQVQVEWENATTFRYKNEDYLINLKTQADSTWHLVAP